MTVPNKYVEYHGFVTHTEVTRLFNYSDILENPGHVGKVILEEMYNSPFGPGPAVRLGEKLGEWMPDWMKYGPFGLGANSGKWLRGGCKK